MSATDTPSAEAKRAMFSALGVCRPVDHVLTVTKLTPQRRAISGRVKDRD
jgi:hypothetical protein